MAKFQVGYKTLANMANFRSILEEIAQLLIFLIEQPDSCSPWCCYAWLTTMLLWLELVAKQLQELWY